MADQPVTHDELRVYRLNDDQLGHTESWFKRGYHLDLISHKNMIKYLFGAVVALVASGGVSAWLSSSLTEGGVRSYIAAHEEDFKGPEGPVGAPGERGLAGLTGPPGSLPLGSIVAWHPNVAVHTFVEGDPRRDKLISLPEGWKRCDKDSTVMRSEYPELFEALDLAEDVVELKLPNLNGEGRFLRGSSNSGVPQSDSTKLPNNKLEFAGGGHDHQIPMGDQGDPTDNRIQVGGTKRQFKLDPPSGGGHGHTVTGGDAETRPKNMSVVWIIRVK